MDKARRTRMKTTISHKPLLIVGTCLMLCSGSLAAKTVTLSMDVEIDKVAPEDAGMYRVGGHDLDRVTYDDATVDPVTHRVRVTSLSHYIAGHWMGTDPADASTLDLGQKPYRLNFVSSVNHGRLIVALFEGDTMRMAMLARPDFHMLIAGKYVINPAPLSDAEVAAPPAGAGGPDIMPMLHGPMPAGAHHKVVALDVDILIDQVAADEKGMAIGQHHTARVFYDEGQVDPASHRVALLHEQHTPFLIPRHLNPAQMPMSNAWLDLGTTPIGYHFAAAPTVGFPYPYFILFDEQTHRMTIRRQSDGVVLLAGAYTVNATPITGPEIDATVGSSDPVVPPWETKLQMPMAAH
ncbi:MAG: hypothetical protein RL684_1738 [Pseudomonadota bacterium]